MIEWAVFALIAVVFNVPALRRQLLSRPLLGLFRSILPQISQTEREALDAGTVWWEGELFSGRPDWRKLLSYPAPKLSAEEQAFVDGPVDELCSMVDDWQVTHELGDLPAHVWDYIKAQGFLGMIIPKAYGGKGFSALAHSEVVMKLTSRSSTAAVSVMVPNSLGPAELLLHYGTQAQKEHYLPRLAQGLEMPCFALTSPEAGSDAGGIPDFGIVCRAQWQGEADVLGIRVTWEKRYITLGPIATLLGLAFRLYDPQHLIGGQDEVGITLALIPTDTPGVHIGRRHLPLDSAFMNGPNWGRDVFIPMAYVIGGVEYAGQGWRMLMNCLAAGRSISLPANGVGVGKLCALTAGAYGRVRSQFNLSIGRFEGVEEAIARIGGNLYVMDAARVMTAGAVDLGEKPAVVSAIVKYHLTERGRQVINDAMDVHAGKGICLGPSNYLARAYQATPIPITVEGANILTRSMIIFGQGAIRGHPWVREEIEAVGEADRARALARFDRAFFGHVGFIVSNFCRALWLGLSEARLARSPGDGHTRRYYQQLTRMSAGFAFTADVCMLLLGGALKRRELLSARLGDILSQMYLACAALKRYHDAGSPADDLPMLHWGVRDALYRIQEAFFSLFCNLPNRAAVVLLRWVVFPLGRLFRVPPDSIGQRIARTLSAPGPARERLTRGAYVPKDQNDAIGTLEAALVAVIAAEPVEAKIQAGVRAGKLGDVLRTDRIDAALAAGVIDAAEANLVRRAVELRRKAIMVDDFPRDLGPSEIHQTTEAVSFEPLWHAFKEASARTAP
ncbi:MAG: acyl-CoA dehydrogenase [Burkholderiales bacterium]|nr:acyl-CoA dehydrogenase [Burkholderiales bacterium]